jgi:hypothetical protein
VVTGGPRYSIQRVLDNSDQAEQIEYGKPDFDGAVPIPSIMPTFSVTDKEKPTKCLNGKFP